MIALKIQYMGIRESDTVSAAIWDYVEHLERLSNQIMSCHVLISRPARKKHKGSIYHIKIRLHLRGTDIIIDRDKENNTSHEDVYVALRDAFDAAKRKVEDYVRVQSGQVKQRIQPMHARIIRIFHNEGCGFLLAEDQREIYFHRNALINGDFENLKVGQEVHFSEEQGENGPQATSLQLIGHSGRHISM